MFTERCRMQNDSYELTVGNRFICKDDIYFAMRMRGSEMGNSMDKKYTDIRGSLIFSESKIELNLMTGEVYEGIFEIEEIDGLDMEGYVYSSSIRMRPGVEHFEGDKIKIPYEFDSVGMHPGDVLKGSFSIVSNRGEYVLPFVAMLGHDTLESSLGSIKNLFHFTNLAKSNWEEAAAVFCDPFFIDIMNGNDAKYRDLYIGLSKRGNVNCNLEEFLIGIGKKQMIEYSLDKTTMKLTCPQGSAAYTVDLERNGWGHTLLAVKAEGDFIELSTGRLDVENFLGNICHYEFVIHEDRLHDGNNYGRITFKYMYGSVALDILVTNTNYATKNLTAHKKKSVYYSLVRHYLDYCTGKINQNKWIQLSEDLISHRVSIDSDDLENNLYQTHLLLVQERYNEAKWILDRKLADTIEDAPNEYYCYYLYLMSLYNVDEYYTKEVNNQIRSIYEKDRTNWRVAWIMLHTSDELKRNPARMYSFALGQMELGCSSPIFYVEIVQMLNKMPSLLVHFDEQEKQVLLFAAKNGLIGGELAKQIAYQATSRRGFDTRILNILMRIYDSAPTEDCLQAICTQLMKGDMVGTKYFKWYEAGVAHDFAITKLYECYMMSLNLLSEQPIPRSVLMYFSYQSVLPVAQMAYLYAYIVKNKDELNDIYMTYRDVIDRFVLKQLYAEKINRDLAYLYQEIVLKDMNTVDNLRQFSKLLLKHCIKVDDPTITNVIVLDERLKDEIVYPVVGGEAYVTLLSSEYTVLLEDRLGNRFYMTKEYNTERYFLPRKLLPKIEMYTEDSLLFDLYICEGNKDYIVVTDRNVGRYRYLEEHEQISDDFRAAIRLPLIRYYQEKEDATKLDEILNNIRAEDVLYKDRDELLRLLVSRGYLDKAYEYALYYGTENTDPMILARIATQVIDRDGLIEDPRLTAMIVEAFDKGKYNDSLLLYLVNFYKGLAKNLRNIWKAASRFYVDTYAICETMIRQTLTTGAYIGEEAKILREYVDGGAKTELELEYLEYFAHEYFARDRIVDEYMFQEMERMYENEGTLPIICMLAYLKFYADGGNVDALGDNTKKHIDRYIHVLHSQNDIVMPFMKCFRGISAEAAEMNNLSMIEYRGEAGAHVTINYCVTRENDDAIGYTREEMKSVYGGVYAKTFLLFFGETLQYYITEELGGMEQLTESGTISRNDVDTESTQDRYGMVNDIAIADTLKDYDTALELLTEYKYKEFVVDSLFTPQ